MSAPKLYRLPLSAFLHHYHWSTRFSRSWSYISRSQFSCSGHNLSTVQRVTLIFGFNESQKTRHFASIDIPSDSRHLFVNFFCTCIRTAMSSPVKQSVPESPNKRKLSSPATVQLSPTKKASKMENVPAEGVLKEITGNQVISTGAEPALKPELISVEKSRAIKLRFKKITENAFEPSKGSKLAAGFDLKSAYEYTVPKRGSCMVKTDIQIQLPSGTYGRVAPRSGLALKHQIDVGAGVIDEDYRGNIGVILFNHGDEDFKVVKGDRIAQLICEKICYPEVEEVETLGDSERGSGGFGSTGVKSD